MLEEYDKKQTEAEHPEPETPQPTLKDVLANQEKSGHFGNYLKREGLNSLAKNIAFGDLEEGDVESLNEHLATFNKTMERAEQINTTITPEALQLYAHNSPDFAKVMQMVGPEAAANIYKKKMAELSISDPERFNEISKALKTQEDYVSGRGKKLEDQVKEYCKKHNLKESSVIDAYSIKDEDKRKKAIQGTVREGYGWFKKTVDWVSAGSFSQKKVEYINDGKQAIDSYRKRLNSYRGSIGETLAMTADGNPEVRSALSQVLVGEQIKNNVGGFQEMKGKMPTNESFQASWEAYKRNQRNVNWNNLPEDQKNDHIEKFIEQQKNENKKTGFWSSIFGALFGMYSNQNKSNLK